MRPDDTVVSDAMPDAGAADDGRDLVAACRAFRCGEASVDALLAEISRARLYTHRPARPGVLVTAMPGGPRWACAFSSLSRLAAAAAGGAAWFSDVGRDLLPQLPAEVGLLIDPADPHGVALLSEWLPRPGGDDERILG